ncbi:GDSL-type esterase/lipase family protein [Kordiimonas pumila]|uniref:GDSL-type esterase/lipase family protein n=1 Tax=Kordiimonas pumila TaxID=2161677 RepID=A0ABV7D981_9PROT|nr:GDSL-type esterase/lipase family protein [Kordiimonas pumila]
MKNRITKPITVVLGMAIPVIMGLGPATAGQPSSMGDITLRDFAAKWMMQLSDIANIGYYAAANEALLEAPDNRRRVVLMGDSITFHWEPESLPKVKGVQLINRGIAGQNSSQMLLRFEDDVVALGPKAVVILAGTNDLRSFVGSPRDATPQMVARLSRNIMAMCDIANAHGIYVVLSAIPPVGAGQDPNKRDPEAILIANEWLHQFAKKRGYAFVDYYNNLVGDNGYLVPELTHDGLHPNIVGYRRMSSVFQRSLETLFVK